jgi:hypothetical protein
MVDRFCEDLSCLVEAASGIEHVIDLGADRAPPTRLFRSALARRCALTAAKHQSIPGCVATGRVPSPRERYRSLFLCIFRFQIANDGLPSVVHMHMLHTHELLSASTQPSEYLNLSCVSPH